MQLSVSEAARFLNVPEKTVYRWADAGEIPSYRLNDQYRFHPAELLEWAATRNLRVSSGFFRPAEAGSEIPTVSRALERGGIHHPRPEGERNRALRAMVDLLPLPEGTDRTELCEILTARESLGSTALGDGIAIPHVRYPLVLETGSAALSLFLLEPPIDFDAPDGRPVHAFFLLISSTVKSHLLMLSRLVTILRDPAVQAGMKRRASPEELLKEIRRVEAETAPRSGGSK